MQAHGQSRWRGAARGYLTRATASMALQLARTEFHWVLLMSSRMARWLAIRLAVNELIYGMKKTV